GDGALTPRHVKRMGLWPSALHKCRKERRIKDKVPQLNRMPEPSLLQERQQHIGRGHQERTSPRE
ncbi:hypothetical protein PIB30_115950, partial [Stylosanthes scabra]|nr:hypothetical protein [Stylosanthes scabra]